MVRGGRTVVLPESEVFPELEVLPELDALPEPMSPTPFPSPQMVPLPEHPLPAVSAKAAMGEAEIPRLAIASASEIDLNMMDCVRSSGVFS